LSCAAAGAANKMVAAKISAIDARISSLPVRLPRYSSEDG
jgi:hypothetical protein